jgi:hypothetical protein
MTDQAAISVLFICAAIVLVATIVTIGVFVSIEVIVQPTIDALNCTEDELIDHLTSRCVHIDEITSNP